MANVITTLLRMDATQLRAGLKGAQQSIKETDGVINKAKAGWASAFAGFASSPVAIGAASAAVTAFAVDAVGAASDLNESINAVNVTFGESADKILEFGENAARSVGLAKSEFNQLATPLGAILKNAGTPLDEVADKTIVLTQRAADMASVFNTDVSDALTAIQAGLRGEQDPLERFGVSLSAAKVEARALADTGKDNAKALTDQEKQLARVNLILDQTNQTAGDFKNTSDGLANQTRVLKAEYENLKAELGQQLIPVLEDVEGSLLDILEVSKRIPGSPPGWLKGVLTLNPLGQQIRLYKELADGVDFLTDKWSNDATPASDRFNDSILRGAAAAAEAAPAIEAVGTAAGDTADEVADLGDKAANAGPKIGDMAGVLADLPTDAEKAAEALGLVAEAAQAVGDAVDDAFSDFDDDLDQLDRLDDIEEDFKNLGETGEEGVRQIRREIGRFLRDLDDIPPDKKVEILAELRNADVEGLRRILDDLTKDRFINIGIAGATTPGFTSSNFDFNPQAGTITPTFQGVQPAIPSQNITVIYPVGTTPTTQFVDNQIDVRRNGARTTLS